MKKAVDNSISEECIEVDVIEYYRKDLGLYHRLTHSQVFGTPSEREAMGISLSQDGQETPILLWKKAGKVHMLDGRNRLDACVRAGITTIWAKHLPTNRTLEQLETLLGITRARVNETKTQMAITAYKWTQSKGLSQVAASAQKGVSKKLIEHCAKIAKIRPRLLDILFTGTKYKLANGRESDSLAMIRKELEQEELSLTRDATQGQDEKDPNMAICFEIMRNARRAAALIVGNESAGYIMEAVNKEESNEFLGLDIEEAKCPSTNEQYL